jgi:type VI secretion system secreted protein Hcp
MTQNSMLVFVAVINLLIFSFVAAIVYDKESTLGGEEDESGDTREDVTDGTGTGSEQSSSYYIQIGDIKGDADDAKHKEWIEVLSYSHGISSPDSPLNPNSGRSQPFSILKLVDSSSPLLMKAMGDGDKSPVILHALKYNESSGENDDHYYTIHLFGARIVSIRNGPESGLSSTGATAPPTEEVTFVFGRIDWTYEETGITYSEDWQDGQGQGGSDEGPRTTTFLKIDGMNLSRDDTRTEWNDGTRASQRHKEWIEVLSYSHGISGDRPTLGVDLPDQDPIEYQDTDYPGQGIGSQDRDRYEPIKMICPLDEAAPELLKLMASGEEISGTIEFVKFDPVKSNGDEVYLRVRFSETTIAEIDIIDEWSISGDADDRPTEELTFNWGRLQIDWVDAGVTHDMDRENSIECLAVQEQAVFMDLSSFFDVLYGSITEDDRWDWRNNPVYSYEHNIQQQIDAASGLPTGKRQHRPVQVVWRIDKSSPLLFKAMVDGTTFDLMFRFLVRDPNPTNTSMMLTKTVFLTNASVVSVLDLDDHPDLIGMSDMQKISFAYESIKWEETASGITAEDDWEAPVA